MRRRLTISLLVAVPLVATVTLLGIYGCGSPNNNGGGGGGGGDGKAVELKGVGATFVQPIMKDWTEKYLKETNDRVKVSYDAQGSGKGIAAMTSQEADFGCSDAPMTKKQLEAAKGPVVHVPTVIGGVVPVYSLAGVTGTDKPLAFTGPVLADIFAGRITAWNDPKIAAANPGVTLPPTAVKPVYRSDKSGTSYIFTAYLGKVSAEFKAAIPADTEPKWPIVGSKQMGSNGVADTVARTDGAIGYVELTYALDNKLTFGAVVNKAGKPVVASLGSITKAAEAVFAAGQTPEQRAEPYSLHPLTYDLSDAPGEASYPIAAMSFAVIYQKQPADKGKTTVEFLKWITAEKGQRYAGVRNFAPLPPDVRAKAAEALSAVEVGQ